MSTLIDPRERFIHRTGLVMLLGSALASGSAAFMHSRQAHPNLMDLLLPSGFSLFALGLFVYLYRRPGAVQRAIHMAFAGALLAIVAPAWIYPIEAWRTGGSLVATLPPILAGLLALILIQIVFMRPRHAFIAAALAWVLVGAPILAYLIAHPAELMTPRGMDLMMGLGPVMALLLVFIPFHRGIERWLDQLQRERATMVALAERDGLTGLYNRRAGESLLTNLLASPDEADALIVFDIDRFKRINDTFGHPAGDEVLRQVARRCSSVLRTSDLFARWGGEEFLVLVRGASNESLVGVADLMRRSISAEPIDPVGVVTASFGVSRFRPYDTMASWIERADRALYAAKEGGRDRVVSD